MYTFQTNRLNLRLPSYKDVQFFLDLLNSPGWLENIGERNVKSNEQSIQYINILLEDHNKDGYGFYVIETKDTRESIGTTGLIKREIFEDLDIGFATLPQFMKKGYTYEASLAVLDFGFNKLQLKRILGITSPENIASQKLLEKLGLSKEGEVDFKGENTLLYAIQKEQFK